MPGPSNALSPSQTPSQSSPKGPTMAAAPTPTPRQIVFDEETDTLLQKEEEVLQQAAKEEEDLYKALENFTQGPFDPATEEKKKARK